MGVEWGKRVDPGGLRFLQTEASIRDIGVTGVQTCALPILPVPERDGGGPPAPQAVPARGRAVLLADVAQVLRVEREAVGVVGRRVRVARPPDDFARALA